MIIFDTNIVRLLPPNGDRAEIIKRLRRFGPHRVAVPWMVMEELIAHQARNYYANYTKLKGRHQALREVTPWDMEDLEPLELDRFRRHWRRQYSQVFEVIKTSPRAAREALSREAMGLKPAKQDSKHPAGARDVAIWFSILEFMRENPDEVIYFVTENTSDFGDGVNYPYPMNEDLEGMEERIFQFRSFDAVLSRFTKEVPGEVARAAAEDLLGSERVRSLVSQTAWKMLNSDSGFDGLAGTPVQWMRWVGPPEAQLLTISDVTGHELEGAAWYSAQTRWLLYGAALERARTWSSPRVACVWELKILFSPNDGDEPPTLLTPASPTQPEMDTLETKEALLAIQDRLRQRQMIRRPRHGTDISDFGASLAELARPDLSHLFDAMATLEPPLAEMFTSLREQIAASLPAPDIASLLPDFSHQNALLIDHFVSSLPTLDIAGALHDPETLPDARLEASKADIPDNTENESEKPDKQKPEDPGEAPEEH